MKSRYRNKYLKPNKVLTDSDTVLRQLVEIDSTWYVVLMIGVMWLPDIQTLEFNPERCVVGRVNPHNGEVLGTEMFNVLLKST